MHALDALPAIDITMCLWTAVAAIFISMMVAITGLLVGCLPKKNFPLMSAGMAWAIPASVEKEMGLRRKSSFWFLCRQIVKFIKSRLPIQRRRNRINHY